MPGHTQRDGKVAVITGAGRGLGLAMARGLLRSGTRVVAVDVDAPVLDALMAGARDDGTETSLVLHPADVTLDASADAIVGAALGHFGRLDILVNNAGLNLESLLGPGVEPAAKFWEIAPAHFRRIIEVNTVAPFLLIRAAVAPMLAQRWGRIVNVTTSLDTMFRQGMIPYGGSKAASEAHSSAMAADLAGTGVTVNVLVPGGMVKTRMTASAPERWQSGMLPPEIMVAPLLWLTGPDADAYTGRRIIAAHWDDALPVEASLERCGAAIAWPQVGNQAIFPI